MRFATSLLILILLTPIAFAEGPEDVLDQYFKVLTSRNIENLPNLMAPGDMRRLKELMDGALTQDTRASRQLQQRMFGTLVDRQTIAQASPDLYLLKLSGEILEAANMQKFFVDNRSILGRIDEADNMVHFVVRIYMHQQSLENSSLLVYTLIEENGEWRMKFPPILAQSLGFIEAMTAPPQP